MTIASLAMYPFPQLRSAYDQLVGQRSLQAAVRGARVGLGRRTRRGEPPTTICCSVRRVVGR